MQSLDLKNAVEGRNENNFHVLLFRLMMKADVNNFYLLAKAFPNAATMLRYWREMGKIGMDLPYD